MRKEATRPTPPILRNGASEVKMGGPAVEVVTVTPQMADTWLALQPEGTNRRLVQFKVDNYAADMMAGRWHLSEAAICFDKNGHLINGQHRLRACIQSGVPFQTVVVRGMDRDSQLYMDIGTKRSFGHVLQMRGETSTAHRAAAARTVAILANPVNRAKWTVPFADHVYALNKEAIDICMMGLISHDPYRNSGIIGACAFCFRKTPDTVLAFMEKLVSGENLQRGDPILALRNYLAGGAWPRAGEALAPSIVHTIHNVHFGVQIAKFTPPRSNGAVLYFRAAHPEY